MNKLFFIILFTFISAQYAPPFNEEKAFEYLLKQCSFGPRNPGSQGHVDFKWKVQNLIVSLLSTLSFLNSDI